MRPSVRSTIGAALAISLSGETLVARQQPAGIPALSPPQLQAITDLTAAISPLVDAVISARDEVVAASFALSRRDGALRDRVEALRAVERSPANIYTPSNCLSATLKIWL